MYSTSYKRWTTSLIINTIVLGLFVAGVLFAVPHTLQIGTFFLWWTCVLGALGFLFMIFFPAIAGTQITEGKELLKQYEANGIANSVRYNELKEKTEKAEASLASLWSDKLVGKLAVSRTYLTYHWLTDIALWVLLIVSGSYALASIRVFVFLLSCLMIGAARKLYRERNGLPDPDVAVYVVQTGNVAGGDIAGRDIHK